LHVDELEKSRIRNESSVGGSIGSRRGLNGVGGGFGRVGAVKGDF
jgi:hypothetical protein